MFIFVNASKPRTINLADELNKMTIKNTLVQPKDIPTIWSFAEKHLKKSVNRSYGRISLNDLLTE